MSFEPSKDDAPTQHEFINDVDDLIYDTPLNVHYRGVLLIDDKNYIGTTNNVEEATPTLVPKVAFVTIPNWKSYVQIFLYMRSGNGKHGPKNIPRQPTDLCEAHVYLGRGCIQHINVEVATPEFPLPNLEREKLLAYGLTRSLVFLLTITYDGQMIRQHGFPSSEPHPVYSELSTAQQVFQASKPGTVRLLISSNQMVLDVVSSFIQELELNAQTYEKFYPKHPRYHFLQLGDYPPPEVRPIVRVPASPTLDSFSEYSTVYGYGCIYEHEVMEKHVNSVSSNIFQLRVMDIPSSGDKCYIGFLAQPAELNARFEVGESLKINFDTKVCLETEDWTAVVLEPLPCAPHGEVCTALFRRWDSETNEYDTYNLNSLSSEILSIEDAFVQVSQHPPHEVVIKMKTDTKRFHRQINGLHSLYEKEHCRWWHEYLLGKDVSSQRKDDIFARCSEEAMQLLNIGHFNLAQTQGVAYTRELPNGIGLITGPAGTGKSTLITTIIQPFLSGGNSQVLLCTPDNATADNLAERVYRCARNHPQTENAIMIRVHSISTEKDVIDIECGKAAGDKTTDVDDTEKIDLPQLSVASMISAAFKESQRRPHGTRDSRYIKHFMGLATWMLRVAGIIDRPLHPKADPQKHLVFADYYCRVAEGEELDAKDRKTYGATRKRLREHTLQMADIVITTVSNTGDAALYTAMDPTLMIVDEATRVIEPDMWNLLGNYHKNPLILVGDENQLRPVVLSTVEENGFVNPLRLSLFQRLKMLGHPSIMLNIQYRMNTLIGSMVSKLFYADQLINGLGTDISKPHGLFSEEAPCILFFGANKSHRSIACGQLQVPIQYGKRICCTTVGRGHDR
jgi:hypothetical protein